jgi:hypothetical protein
MTEAVQSRFVGLEELADEVRRAGRSRTAVVRYVLTEIVDGARSAPEAELRQALLASRKLPAILWNPQLVAPDGTALPTPDAYLADVSLAIEVDSRAHHMDDEGWRRTLSRANQLGEHGVSVLHFTPTEIRHEPARVRRVVERTYSNRRATGAGADGGTLLRKK